MKVYRKFLRLGVALLACSLFALNFYRGAPRASRAAVFAPSARGGSLAAPRGDGDGSAPADDALAEADDRARRPYRPRQRPIIYPAPIPTARHGGGYATWLWTDAFLKDGGITIISQCYVGMPRDYGKVILRAKELSGGEGGFTTIHVRDAYESVIMARLEAPALASLERLALDVEFEGVSHSVTLLRAPGGWESEFAMCALFLQDRHLLGVWATYWYLLGVDTFYLYWNGEVKGIEELKAAVEHIPAHVVFIHWPFDYWVPNHERPHHGQPQAWNSCYQRNRDKHDFLVFYDLVRRRARCAIFLHHNAPHA
jgi:hypothetical protein